MKLVTGDEFGSERLCEILDFIVQEPKLERACRYAGYQSKWIWAALKRSGRATRSIWFAGPTVNAKLEFSSARQ